MILAFDPSGNFKEGKGTTGYCILDADTGPIELGEIKAKYCESAEEYWNKHLIVMDMLYQTKQLDAVVIEGYRLYNHRGMKASTQANSELETPQLIGLIKWKCYDLGIPCTVQYASEVKTRWSDTVLVNIGQLEKLGGSLYFRGTLTNNHKRDALRHALHYGRYKHE